ncbi:hypothetical protein V6U84_42715 [Micromonospora sp. CPCC 205714]
MRVHRTDLVSLAFGLLFLGLSVWWLLAQILGLALPPVGWFLAGALVVIGLLGLVGALRSGRHEHEPMPASGATPAGPEASATGWPDPPAGPRDTADDAFPGPGTPRSADGERRRVSAGREATGGGYRRDDEATLVRPADAPDAERETAEAPYPAAGADEDALTRPPATTQERFAAEQTAEVRFAGPDPADDRSAVGAASGTPELPAGADPTWPAGPDTADIRLAGPDQSTAPVWGPDGTADRTAEARTRAIGPAGDADEWPTTAVSDRPAEAVEDRPADAPDDSPHWSPVAPVSGPPAGERRSRD